MTAANNEWIRYEEYLILKNKTTSIFSNKANSKGSNTDLCEALTWVEMKKHFIAFLFTEDCFNFFSNMASKALLKSKRSNKVTIIFLILQIIYWSSIKSRLAQMLASLGFAIASSTIRWGSKFLNFNWYKLDLLIINYSKIFIFLLSFRDI